MTISMKNVNLFTLYFALMVATGFFALAACNDIKHPLDDSATRPATEDDAIAEATAMLDDMATTTMVSESFIEVEWADESGCATHPDSPEQGDVGRILYRTYSKLPGSSTIKTLMANQRSHWEDNGYTVQENAPNMPATVMFRPNSITYYLNDAPPGVELRAFLPCY